MIQVIVLAAGVFCSAGFAIDENTLQERTQVTESANQDVQSYIKVPLQKQYVPMMSGNKVLAYKASYFGELRVGTPRPQTFTVVFDTGSAHFILPSAACKSSACLKHRRFDRVASSSAVDIEYDGKELDASATERDQVSIAFGTGEVLGDFVRDKLCLGTDREACIDLSTVVASEMSDEPFGLFSFDGVMGLGMASLALQPHFSFFSELIQQHKGMQPQFGVFLSRHDGGESEITFGGYDPSRATSDLKWSPVVQSELGYWQVQIKGIRIGDQVVEECADGSCHAILDTGTSLLGVPRDTLRNLHRMLARPVPDDHIQPGSSIDCRTVPGAKIHFDLGDHEVTLDVEDYARPVPFNMTMPAGDRNWRLMCRSLLLPVDMEEPMVPKVFIWGEPVLRRFFTVYDVGAKRIGFSEARKMADDSRGLPVIGAPPSGSLVSGGGLRRPTSDTAASVDSA